MKKRKPASIIKNCKFCGQTVGSKYSTPICKIKIPNELNSHIQDFMLELYNEIDKLEHKTDYQSVIKSIELDYTLRMLKTIVERGKIYHNLLNINENDDVSQHVNKYYRNKLIQIIGCPISCSEREYFEY